MNKTQCSDASARTCHRCGRVLATPQSLSRHLERQNPCKPKKKPITLATTKTSKTSKTSTSGGSKKKPTKVVQSVPAPPRKAKRHKCPHCSQSFTRTDNLQRHIDHRCPKLKEQKR